MKKKTFVSLLAICITFIAISLGVGIYALIVKQYIAALANLFNLLTFTINLIAICLFCRERRKK